MHPLGDRNFDRKKPVEAEKCSDPDVVDEL